MNKYDCVEFRAGTISHYRYTIDTILTDTYHTYAVPIQMMVKAAKTNDYFGPKTISFTHDFHTIINKQNTFKSILCLIKIMLNKYFVNNTMVRTTHHIALAVVLVGFTV